MDRDTGDFQDFTTAAAVGRTSDGESDARMPMVPTSLLSSTDEETTARIARARADVAAGRYHTHTVVSDWLRTWGSPDYRPFDEWIAARDG